MKDWRSRLCVLKKSPLDWCSAPRTASGCISASWMTCRSSCSWLKAALRRSSCTCFCDASIINWIITAISKCYRPNRLCGCCSCRTCTTTNPSSWRQCFHRRNRCYDNKWLRFGNRSMANISRSCPLVMRIGIVWVPSDRRSPMKRRPTPSQTSLIASSAPWGLSEANSPILSPSIRRS